MDTYYVPYRKDGARGMLAKGKLVSKYYHLRSEMKAVGLLGGNKSSKSRYTGGSDEISDEVPAELKGPLNFLKKNVEPWDTVVKHWRETSTHRTTALQAGDGGHIGEYVNTYLCLKHKLGFTLIEIDFEKLHEDYGTTLFQEWESFASKAIRAFQNNSAKSGALKNTLELLDNDELSEDAKNLSVLLTLAELDQVVTLKKGKKRGESWRPTHAEIQEGFVSQISSVGKLDRFKTERRDKLYKYGYKLQPFVVICGPSVEEVDACYVVADGYQYLMTNPLRALDVCFKFMHATHALYPAESYRVWMLIQKKLYNLETVFDNDIKDTQLPSLLKKFI